MKIVKPAAASIISLLFLAIASIAQAHLPYLEEGASKISIKKPEISKIYYGWLQGHPVTYSISSPKPFKLYINLLSPQLSDSRIDFSASIYKDDLVFDEINGADSVWLAFYEPFANDYYIKGPEYEKNVPAGNYQIEIYNLANRGDYALAIGKNEDLSFGEFVRTLAVLPQVKEKFFGKDPWEAYNNFIGLAAFILFLLVSIAIYLIIRSVIFYRLRKRLDRQDYEYKNNRKNRGEDRIGLSEIERLFNRR